MRYLILTPEVTAAPLRDEFELPSEAWPMVLDAADLQAVERWNGRYLDHLFGDTGSPDNSIRIMLDEEGMRLAEYIGKKYQVKVRFLAG